MPMIRPSSDLRNNYNDISEYVTRTNEPVFITMNGHGDTVIMSMEAYDAREQLLMDQAIAVSEAELAAGGEVTDAREALQQLREKHIK